MFVFRGLQGCFGAHLLYLVLALILDFQTFLETPKVNFHKLCESPSLSFGGVLAVTGQPLQFLQDEYL